MRRLVSTRRQHLRVLSNIYAIDRLNRPKTPEPIESPAYIRHCSLPIYATALDQRHRPVLDRTSMNQISWDRIADQTGSRWCQPCTNCAVWPEAPKTPVHCYAPLRWSACSRQWSRRRWICSTRQELRIITSHHRSHGVMATVKRNEKHIATTWATSSE